MPKDIYEIMLNPTRMRIVQTLAVHENMTTMELCEVIKDVPRTTLYRHISILIDANILAVIAEKKIRGSLERTLALNVDELKRHNTTEDISQQALRFMMNTYVKFEKYFGRDNFLPGTNKIFFNNTVMMLSDQEFDLFLSELQALFVKYHFEVVEGRKARDISIISAPPAVNENE
jgi:DNA-binding transcriptional ArsR family regulator